MTFAAALWDETGNEDPTMEIVLTPEPERVSDYERALADVAAVLAVEISMSTQVIAYLLDLARARERVR